MHPDLLDILSNKESAINNKQLVDYLTGKMSEQENNAFEKSIMASGIDDEALEGLQMLHDKEKIHQYQLEINKALREKLQQKKNKTKGRKKMEISSLLILTGSLLALIILVWLLVHYIMQGV